MGISLKQRVYNKNSQNVLYFCRFNKYGILLGDLSTQVIWKLVRHFFFSFHSKNYKGHSRVEKNPHWVIKVFQINLVQQI